MLRSAKTKDCKKEKTAQFLQKYAKSDEEGMCYNKSVILEAKNDLVEFRSYFFVVHIPYRFSGLECFFKKLPKTTNDAKRVEKVGSILTKHLALPSFVLVEFKALAC